MSDVVEVERCPAEVEPSVWDALIRNRQALVEQGGRYGKPLSDAWHHASMKAVFYVKHGVAFESYQPGNGTAYNLVLLDLQWDQTNYLLEKYTRIGREPTPAERDAAREQARAMGPAGSFGGPLLVALPTMGKSMACVDTGWFDHVWLGEHMGLRWPDALRVAEYLTLFTAAVDNRRRQPVETFAGGAS